MAQQFSPARLKRAREEKEFTQKALAAAVGVSYQTYQFWEHGRQVPRVDSLLRLAEVLGKEMSYFVKPHDDSSHEIER